MAISELNDNDLQQIGISLMADRKRILGEIRLLNERNAIELETPNGNGLHLNVAAAPMHNAMDTLTENETEGMYVCDDPLNETAGANNNETLGGFDIIYKNE